MAILRAHTLEHVLAAHDFARKSGSDITLITSENAACYYGVGVMLQWQQAAKAVPFIVGAGENAAIAHEAMQRGVKRIYIHALDEMQLKLKNIAAALGAQLYEDYPIHVVDMRDKEWKEQLNELTRGE